jgi:hypothetical protein
MTARLHRLQLLLLHGARLARGGVLRWRLETFGLYMPSYPNRRPWWRVNGRAVRLLLAHGGAYAGWLAEMEALRRGGAAGWWRARSGRHTDTLAAYVARQNDVPPDDPCAEDAVPEARAGALP